MDTIVFNIDDLLRDNIKSIKPYSSARDEFSEVSSDYIFIDANENPFQSKINRYPDPQQRALKTLIANQKGISVDNILLGNGSDEVLDLIFRAFCEPKIDNVITLPPTYGMYQVLADINDVEVIKVNLTENFQPNVEVILNSVAAKSKILFLCSPNNPTGNSFNETEVELLLQNFKGLVVIDEAYIDFSSQASWLSKLEQYPNLVITQTASKAYGMAGIRLGMCFASKAIIKVLNTIKPPYNVNILTQDQAEKRLQNLNIIKNQVNVIIQERNALTIALKAIPFITNVYQSDANFILVKVDDANKRYKELLSKGIVARNRTTQPGCENCLRFSIGTPEQNTVLINTLNQLNS